jgi:hypothetical protein
LGTEQQVLAVGLPERSSLHEVTISHPPGVDFAASAVLGLNM